MICSSTTSCTATSPGESAGTVDVTISSPGGTSTTSLADQFTYVPVPAITKIAPGSGPTRGGTKVTIQGSNFVGTVSVALRWEAGSGRACVFAI